MGHRVPTTSNRLGINRSFDRIWYSDLHYNYLFYTDMTLSKYISYLIHRYYKHKVRFLRGKHRRRRSTLRIAGVLTKRFYNKTTVNFVNYRQKKSILKNSFFIPLQKKTFLSKFSKKNLKRYIKFHNLNIFKIKNYKNRKLVGYTYNRILKKLIQHSF